MARGARRSKKRFAGMLEIGNRVRLDIHPGRGKLARIQGVELVAGVQRAREDLLRLSLLAYGCEALGRLAGEHQPAPRLARLLVVWVERLEHDGEMGVAHRQALEAKALRFAGLLPDLHRCARCSRPLVDHASVPTEGGVLHPACGPGVGVEAADLLALDRLLRTPLFEIRVEQASGAGWLLCDRIQHHLRAPLKSATLLRELL